ncbi:MAG: alpha/beta fold hydrolase [Saprospiraceae bacterium]
MNTNKKAIFQLWVFRLLRRKRTYFSIAMLGLFGWLYHALGTRLDDGQLVRRLNSNPFGLEAAVHYFEEEGRRMRYVEIGYDSLPLIVFVHGAPSSSSFWEGLLRDTQLLRRAKLLAIDRPGYGYSGYGRAEVSVKKQAALIAPLLKEKRLSHQTIIVHGSSYGGTVSARLAMDYPQLVDGVLLQSSSNMPGAETTYWISYPTSHWALRWLIPGALRVANAEKLSHAAQLHQMANGWKRITGAVIILHGLNDRLIFPENAAYAKHRLVNAAFLKIQLAAGSRHDLLWTQRALLIRSLQELLIVAKK